MTDTENNFEQRLATDHQGLYKSEVITDLQQLRASLQEHLRSGLPPLEYEKLASLTEATEAAEEVVEYLWNRQHQDPLRSH